MVTVAGGEGAARRKNRAAIWVGRGGGGGLLLIGGGILAATAAVGVAFFVRALTKRRGKATSRGGGEAVVEQGEEGEGVTSDLPPTQAAPPPSPSRQAEEISGSNDLVPAAATLSDEAAAFARESDLARAVEKIITESSLVGGLRGGGEDYSLPAIVNKAVVVNESKIIQVVGEIPPLAVGGGSGREGKREKDEGSLTVVDAKEDPMGMSAEPPQLTSPAKAKEPASSLLELIRTPLRAFTSMKEEYFAGNREKLRAERQLKTPWKEERKEKASTDRTALEMTERGSFSRTILVSTVFLAALVAFLLHRYLSMLESPQRRE